MNALVVPLIFGHLVGDYVLQNKWMAMNKSASTLRCAVHCAIYTASVVAFTLPVIHGWWWALLIFVSHFPIDRWSLADKWLELINGRSLRDYLANGNREIPAEMNAANYHALRGGFTALVYAMVDNTFHLLIMWYGAKLLVSL
jgi:hypothetical protein